MEQYRGDIYAILTACAWSVAVIFFKLSGHYLNTVQLKVFQNVVAVLLFFACIVVSTEPLTLQLTAHEWWLVVISAVAGITLGDTLFIAAINRIGASLQAIVDVLYMPFVMGLAFVFFGERLPAQVFWGAGLVLLAIAAANMDMHLRPVPKRQLFVGIGLALLAQFLMACCVVMLKNLLQSQSLLTLTAYRFLIGTVALIVFYAVRGRGSHIFHGFRPSRAWLVTLPGAFLGPFLATLFWFAGFKYTLAGKAAIYNQLSTILIVIMAALFLKEKLTRHRIAAILLAIAGSYLVLTS
ncbi:MAG: DMT family transporter [Bdellovibrionales bacterium]